MIAIGDIHGCLGALKRLIDKLPDDEALLFLGDYIDRGPDSKGVIDYLMELEKERPCKFLIGNHEEMMIEAAWGSATTARQATRTWLRNGGEQTLASFGVNGLAALQYLDPKYKKWLTELDLFYEVDTTPIGQPKYVFVHAGLDPKRAVEGQLFEADRKTMIWTRAHHTVEGRRQAHENWTGYIVVCGHTPHDEPVETQKMVCLDTGCVYGAIGVWAGGATLSAMRLPTNRKTWRVPATLLHSYQEVQA